MSSSRSQSRQRPNQINSGFTSAEIAAIDERRGPYSRAAWLRNAALAAIGHPIESPGRPGLPTEDIAAIAALSGDVRRATGAAIQLAKAFRLAGYTGFHALAERILADLRRQADDLTTIIARLK
ncbi:MAG: hypothetical protein Devi2KO_00790 [Devosia indica]